MKSKLAGIVLACLLTAGGWTFIRAQGNAIVSPPLPVGANGRYQVVAADIAPGDDQDMKSKTAIRVDTQTGKTWILTEYQDVTAQGGHGERHIRWVALRE